MNVRLIPGTSPDRWRINADGKEVATLHRDDDHWAVYFADSDSNSPWQGTRADAIELALAAIGHDGPWEIVGEVTTPGIYDMPDDAYHSDPVVGAESLSQTSAKWLLPPNAPAIYRHRRDNPPASTAVFDFGKAVHTLILGAGADVVEVKADNWMTKAAKDQRAACRADGRIPLLTSELAQAKAMRDALNAHPLAPLLFTGGTAEQSLFTVDGETGVWLRGRVDYLGPVRNGRVIVADYKTAQSAAPTQFGKTSADYGYHMQAAWYRSMVRALGVAEDVLFVFVVQSKDAPYLVAVDDLDPDDMALGDRLNRQAIRTFAHCLETGQWPGYPAEVHRIQLPPWYRTQASDYLDTLEGLSA